MTPSSSDRGDVDDFLSSAKKKALIFNSLLITTDKTVWELTFFSFYLYPLPLILLFLYLLYLNDVLLDIFS